MTNAYSIIYHATLQKGYKIGKIIKFDIKENKGVYAMKRRTFLIGAAAMTAVGLVPNLAQAAGERPLIAYFSCTENTKAVAEQIAEITGGVLFEIKPAQAYTDDDLNYRNENSRSSLEMNDQTARPAISGSLPNLSDYKLIYLGYPIWWGTMPRIINTFLEAGNFNGKTIRPFCTSGGSGVEKSVADIKKVMPKAIVKKGLMVSGYSAKSSNERIARWVKQND